MHLRLQMPSNWLLGSRSTEICGGHPKWVHGFEAGFVDFGFSSADFRVVCYTEVGMPYWRNFRIASYTATWSSPVKPVVQAQ